MVAKDEPEYAAAMKMAEACHGDEAAFPRDKLRKKFPLCVLLGIQLRQFKPGEYFIPPREVIGVSIQETDPNGKKHTFALTSGGPMPLWLVVEENANGMIASEKIEGLLSPTWHDMDTLFLDDGTTLAQARKALKAEIKTASKGRTRTRRQLSPTRKTRPANTVDSTATPSLRSSNDKAAIRPSFFRLKRYFH
jgi:hypothetical protein